MSTLIECRTPLWTVPTLAHAFDGFLEGAPSPAREEEILAECVVARRDWSPGADAMAFVERLRAEAVGEVVVVQAWDKTMHVLAGHGPYPVRARCESVLVAPDDDGLLHAYLVVSSLEVLPQRCGSDKTARLFAGPDADGRYRFDLGDLYELEVEGESPPAREEEE